MKNTSGLKLCLFAWMAVSGSLARGAGVESVLLIVTDDQGADLECYGTRGISTPATSRLAREGVLFRRAHAACSSCSPARSSILTGMYPHSNGHWRNTRAPNLSAPEEDFGADSRYRALEEVGVHEDISTLMEILRGEGFVTGITQKFHLSPPWKYPLAHRYPVDHRPDSHGAAVKDFLRAAGRKPFFLMANIGNTHRPFKKHIVKIGAPRVDPMKIDVPSNLPDTPLLRKDLAEYLDTVQCADACAGAILESLRASGRGDSTLVIFTSDQGYCYQRAKATAYDLGVHVPLIVTGPDLKKGLACEHLVSHVDLAPTILDLLHLPVPETVQGVSLRPLLEGREVSGWREVVFSEHNSHGPHAGEFYPIRGAFDGRMHFLLNLSPERHWKGDPASLLVNGFDVSLMGFAGPADAFPGGPWDNHGYEATVRARNEFPLQYRLLSRTFQRPAEELYDHHHDPHEIQNVAGDPGYRLHLHRLRAALEAWMLKTGDPGMNLRERPRRSRRAPGPTR